MQLLCLGLNHTTAPLSVRERVAFGPDEIGPSLHALRDRLAGSGEGALSEAMILSTCNRTEIYCAAEDAEKAAQSLTHFIAETKVVSLAQLEPHLYRYTQCDAARHIFRVVCGIDSMVLGETQIVGQFKKAVAAARENKTLGLMLNHLFQEAFTTAKNVRSHTAIGSNSVGAGEMIELCAAYFGAQKPAAITVANRSIERGQALAARYNGTAMRLQDLPEVIADYDIIVSCTASALPIIGLGMIERAVKKRNHRPICIIDLAVPRDVEPEVARLDDVYVYTMDELGAVVQSGKESRQAAVIQAESYINKAVEEFNRWLAMRAVVPSISRIRERADFIRRQELDRALKEIAAGKDTAKVLDDLSLSLTHKLIHDPTVLIRNAEGLTDVEREHITNIVGRFYRPRTV